jgi:hypothetical protein
MKRAQVQCSVDGRRLLAYGDSLSGDVARKIDWSRLEYELIIHECIIPLLHHHYTPVFYAARILLLLSASITVST